MSFALAFFLALLVFFFAATAATFAGLTVISQTSLVFHDGFPLGGVALRERTKWLAVLYDSRNNDRNGLSHASNSAVSYCRAAARLPYTHGAQSQLFR